MRERIRAKELAEYMGINKSSITTWLCRGEFTEFFRRDRYFKRISINYVFNEEFKKEFMKLLELKGNKEYIEKFKRIE